MNAWAGTLGAPDRKSSPHHRQVAFGILMYQVQFRAEGFAVQLVLSGRMEMYPE